MEKRNDNYDDFVESALKKLLDFFGAHVLSATSFSKIENGGKPVLLIQLDEPLINLLNDSNVSSDGETISPILKEHTDFPIYIITSKEIAEFPENFPIELVHIKNRYRKCFGTDPIGQMDVDFSILHNAVKTSMQGILMHLRMAYLSQNYDDLFIAEIMNRLYPTFESALFLRSQTIPFSFVELAFRIENIYDTKNKILSEIAEKMEKQNTKGIAENMFHLLTTLEKILAAVKEISRGL
jgi:hemolysin-activating ACP:hemolysin acyltransferase